MQISANYYSVLPPRFIAGTRGSYGIEQLEIIFSEEWKGLTKKVVFYPPDCDPIAVFYESDPISIPFEVMKVRGKTKYAIMGYDGNRKLVTVTGEIDVLTSLDDTDFAAQIPTPSEMMQVLSHMREAVDIANSVRRDADNGVFDGQGGNRWFAGDKMSGSGIINCDIEGSALGDYYLNKNTYELYVKRDELEWSYMCTIKGKDGLPGEKGERGYTGEKGDKGEKGEKGDRGEDGAAAITCMSIDIETGMLMLTVNKALEGLSFSLNSNGYLEVTIND